jgi:hypothetical protein
VEVKAPCTSSTNLAFQRLNPNPFLAATPSQCPRRDVPQVSDNPSIRAPISLRLLLMMNYNIPNMFQDGAETILLRMILTLITSHPTLALRINALRRS